MHLCTLVHVRVGKRDFVFLQVGDGQQRPSIHQLQNMVFRYNSCSDEDGLLDVLPDDTTIREIGGEMAGDVALCSPSYLNDGEQPRSQRTDVDESSEKNYMHDYSVTKPTYHGSLSFQRSYKRHLVISNVDEHRCNLPNDKELKCDCPNETFQHKCEPDTDQPFKYDVCNETPSQHTTHERILSDTACHRCDICFRAFNTLVGVNIHKRVHTDYKPFQCDICRKEFQRSSTLYQHKRNHSLVKPQMSVTCKVCGKVFASQTNLTIHTRVHTGDRPYKCDMCDKAFTQAAALNCHRRIHTNERPFVCNICGRTFRQPVGLTYHRRTHTGEKPYKCDLCEKAFSQAGPLAYHKRTHSGERTYKCDRAFSQSAAFTSCKPTGTDKKMYGV